MVTTATNKPRWYSPGNPAFLLPGGDGHSAVISPSKVASICGVSRWESEYTLWHRMKGLCPPEPPKDLFDVGMAFEPALAQLWKIQNPGWRLSRGEVQYHSDAFGFPVCATLDRRAAKHFKQKVVEFKIAHHTDEWGDPGLDGDCPADYALQVIALQTFSGLTDPADLLVMGPFFRHFTYVVSFDTKVSDWMVSNCQRFWDSLSLETPPALDDSVSTYYAVRAMHPDIDQGVRTEVPESLYADIKDTRANLKDAETHHRGYTTKFLDAMGNAQYATVNGEVVADRRPHARGGVSLVVR